MSPHCRVRGSKTSAQHNNMDFTGLNSNPVVFDTSANVRKTVALDEEDDEVIDEVLRRALPFLSSPYQDRGPALLRAESC